MTEFLLPSWYRAVQVPDRREQKTLFDTLEKIVSTINMTLTVNTYMAGGNYYTVIFCLGSTVPSEREQKRLEAALAPYTPFLTLEETFLDALVRARLSKEPEIAKDTQFGRTHVSHQYRPVVFDDAAPLSQEERDQRHQAWVATIEALLAEGKPFVEVFKMIFNEERLTAGSPLVQPDPFQASIFRQMLDHAQLWLWTASARQMHQDLVQALEAFCIRQGWTTPEEQLAHSNSLVTDLFQTEQRLWIEFDEPQPDPFGRVRAVFVYPRYPEQELNRLIDPREDLIAWLQAHQILGQEAARWNIDVIGENAAVLLRLSYDTQYGCWVLPEDQYMSQVFTWTRWLAIATGMLYKRYARSPQAPAFPAHIASYQAKELVPRVRGKGKPKDKWVTHSRTYIKITYDLSDKPSVIRANEMADNERPPKRQNWLAQAQPEDLLYEQRIIDTFTRSYPTRKDGTRREGEVTVKHSEPKWVPLLRPERRKHQVIKKAVAKVYETSPVLPEQETPTAHQSMQSSSVSENREKRREPSC
ncbi:hypothetical protein KSC_044240 [Ktedonobacter sp. SOSP1-52]|uniref:hypothetical protein n=1 Tax=Ktedonobacter sp. SOSP1-52 TaxID=2778366 RepID=UPI001A2A7679|nr:hypothetical protein [Ktedonobacter sp. SOSP1-52]GHO65532.1 hypothetical protein KSC_044240 [Ktedonobacter sp. SOSP1-52]